MSSLELLVIVLVSLAQLERTMHNICKVWDSNPGHHKKKELLVIFKGKKQLKVQIVYNNQTLSPTK